MGVIRIFASSDISKSEVLAMLLKSLKVLSFCRLLNLSKKIVLSGSVIPEIASGFISSFTIKTG
jgi:hypothetical protein